MKQRNYGTHNIIRVPVIKYNQAKEYQRYLQNNRGLNLPLWACLVDSEEQKKNNELQKIVKRFI